MSQVEVIDLNEHGEEIGRRMVDLVPEPEIIAVRELVSNAALCIALAQVNLLAAVDAFVEQLPFDAPAVQLWKKATHFKRSDPLWQFFAPQLGLNGADIDAIFNMAGQIDDSYGGTWQ